MHLQSARERGDRGEQPLLKSHERQLGKGGLLGRQRRDAQHAQVAIGREPTSEIQLWGIVRKAVDDDRLDDPFGEILA